MPAEPRAPMLPTAGDDPDAEEDEPDRPGQSHKKEILAIVDALKLPRDSQVTRGWIEIATGRGGSGKVFAAKTHRRALESVRAVNEDDAVAWRQFEELLVVVLPHLEESIVRLLPRFRELAELLAPTLDDRKDFRRLPNTMRTRSEFFLHATPGWFRLLDLGRFFDQPQDAFTRDVSGQLQPQEWLAMAYLGRMAEWPEHHERFIAVAERVVIPHEWAMRPLIQAGRHLPIELAVRLATRLTQWLDGRSDVFIVGTELAEFAAWLATAGAPAAGAALLRAELALEADPALAAQRTEEEQARFTPTPRTRLPEYEYEMVVERGLAPFARAQPREGFDVGLDLLVRALELSERDEDVATRSDHSVWTRQSLVSEGTRFRHEAVPVLTDVARDAARLCIDQDRAALPAIVTELESREWTLCLRLALQLLTEYPDQGLIRERLLDPGLIRRAGTWPEFRQLLTEYFPKFSPEDRNAYVAGVEQYVGSGADPDFTGTVEPEEWVLRRLRSIAPHVDADVLERHPELARWVKGKLARPDKAEIETGWVGAKGQTSVEELAGMPVSDTVAFLKTWNPPGRLDGPSIEGQGNALQGAVTADPSKYAAEAAAFADLDPTYVRSVLAGLEDVVRTKREPFDWEPVLRLAAAAVAKPPIELRSSFDRDPDWTWTRKTIADVLQHGLEQGPTEIPIELRADVWGLIATLTEQFAAADIDVDGTNERERDAFSAALNSIRGSALLAAVNFVAWITRHAQPQRSDAMTDAPEARELLEQHLANDASLAARGAFGYKLDQLIALDRGWVNKHRRAFFPPDRATVSASTWQAYINWNPPSQRVLELFPEQFAAAIGNFGRSRPSGHLEIEERATEHLMAFYLRGWIDFDSPDRLVEEFYRRAPAWLRGYAIEFLGRVQKDEPLQREHCARLRRLWDVRAAAASAMSVSDRREELEHFGWWFAANVCEEEWRLTQLIATLKLTRTIENDSLVLEKLKTTVAAHPLEAIEVVELMIEEPKDRWLPHVWITDIVPIISTAIAHPEARPRARALGARLVADGFDGGLVALLASEDL